MRSDRSRNTRCTTGIATLTALVGMGVTGAGANGASGMMPAGGKIFVANRASGTVSVISTRTDDVIATVDMPSGGQTGEPMYVYSSPVERRVFVGDRANDRVVAFNARTFEVDGWAPAGAGVFHMWGHPRTQQLWVNNDIDNTTSVISMRTLEVLGTIPSPADLVAQGGKPHDVIIGPEGEFAYVTVTGVAGPADFIVRYDTRSFQETGRAMVGDDPHVSLTPRTEYLYTPCQGGNGVWVLDRFTMNHIGIIDVPGAHGAGMPIGGRWFYTSNLPGGGADALYVIDTQTLSVVGGPVDSPYAVPHNIALTPDGRKLYLTHSGGASDKVTVYAVSPRTGAPRYIGEITVGSNPFGLDYVP